MTAPASVLAMTRQHQSNGVYDESLLEEGRYREWFWQGLGEDHKTYLRKVPRTLQTRYCSACSQSKPLDQFSKRPHGHKMNASSGLMRYKCDACILKIVGVRDLEDSVRWENNFPVNWEKNAPCNGADPEIFFPQSTTAYLADDAEWRKYCLECPFKQLCIDQIHASTPTPQGVFGGILFRIGEKPVDIYTARKVGRPKLFQTEEERLAHRRQLQAARNRKSRERKKEAIACES